MDTLYEEAGIEPIKLDYPVTAARIQTKEDQMEKAMQNGNWDVNLVLNEHGDSIKWIGCMLALIFITFSIANIIKIKKEQQQKNGTAGNCRKNLS